MIKHFKFLPLLVLLISSIFAQNNFTPSLSFGFSERIRLVGWDNSVHLGDPAVNEPEQFFSRCRTSISLLWKISSSISFSSKVTNEFRKYFRPADTEFNLNEIFIDQLYLSLENKALLPGLLSIGRQNIILGEGFIILDGSPLDGSRSIYFNSIRYDWSISKNQVLSLFYIYAPITDDILPTINSDNIDTKFKSGSKFKLTEQSSRAAGLYFSSKKKILKFDLYFVYKNASQTKDLPMLKLNTIGGRVKTRLIKNVFITSELALQFGEKDNFKKHGIGGYTYFDIKTNSTSAIIPNNICIGSFYLSGDDPESIDDQGWDPLYSRWPKWSESYIYTLIREKKGKVAEWNNIHSFYIKTSFSFIKKTSATFSYHRLGAFQNSDSPLTKAGTGLFRGNLFICKFIYRITNNISGHLLWEHFSPGNFYFREAKSYNWIRFETLFSF